MDVTVRTDDLLTIPQAAKIIGVSRITAWDWVQTGRLPSMRIGGRALVTKQTAEAMKRKRDFEAKELEIAKRAKDPCSTIPVSKP